MLILKSFPSLLTNVEYLVFLKLEDQYSGNRLIHPRLMQPTAYSIQIAWHGIFLILSHYKNPG